MKRAVRGVVSLELTKEDEEERDHVREVESHGGEREYCNEGGGVSDVDKAKESGEGDDQSESVERNAERRVNLGQQAMGERDFGSNANQKTHI